MKYEKDLRLEDVHSRGFLKKAGICAAALAAACLLLTMFGTMPSVKAQSGPSVVLITVGVDANGNPTVSTSDAILWSTHGDTAKWVSANVPFTVTFASGTPFAYSTYIGPNASSGAIQAGASGDYKYSVQVGTKILDPKLIVRP